METHPHPVPPDPAKDVAENKDLAALSYVWIASVFVLFAKRESPFAQFHAKQGSVLFGLSLVAWAMPFVGKLAEVLVFALCIMGFLHAARGERRDVPIIGPLSRGSFDEVRQSWKDVVAAVSGLWGRVRPQPGEGPPPPAESQQPRPPAPPHDVPPIHAQDADPAPRVESVRPDVAVPVAPASPATDVPPPPPSSSPHVDV